MAPEVLPKVWAELQARIDICSVVREVLGHFAIEFVGEAPSASESFSFIVWMKVIYDLQRTYLQSSNPSSETLSYLLPPRILFKTIHRILEIRPRLRHAENQNYPAQQPRYFAAQTLLSGVRALQLRGISETTPDLEDLHAIEILIQKWVEDSDEGQEKFILNKCHSGLVQMRRGLLPSSVWNKPACNACDLRDNAIDLYPALTKKMMNVLNSQLSQETSNLDSQDQFWARFDIIWAVEAGYIQWCADKVMGKNVIDDKCEVGSLVHILENTTRDSHTISVLNHTWHNQKHGQIHTERVDPDRLQVDIDKALSNFHFFLRNRRAKLVDYNLEIRRLSTGLGQNIESWIRRASGYNEEYGDIRGGEQPLKTAYVLGCPLLHVVPEHQLKSIYETYGNNEHIFLNNPALLDFTDFSIYCPRCSSATVFKYARRIDPLNTISSQLELLVETSTTAEGSNASQQLKLWRQNKVHWPPSDIQNIEAVPTQKPDISPVHDIPSSPSSPNPQPSSPSSSINNVKRIPSNRSEESKSNRTTGTSRLSNIFRRKSSIPSDIVLESTLSTQKHIFNSYCFSSDGKILILWNNRANHIYCSVIPTTDDPEAETSWDWMKFGNGLGSVDLVASAEKRVAIILKEEKKSRLLVFGISMTPNLEPILERVLPKDKKLINKSLCVSPDGGIVAVGTDKEVLVYHINNSINNAELKPRIIRLSAMFSGMDVFSQVMNFSQDCQKLVIATRYYNDGNCEIEIILYDLLGSREMPEIKTKPHEFTSTDNGLTAIFYDHRKKEIILTGSINKSYGNVYSRKNSHPIYWPPEISKIQTAVACPSESQYIFLGSLGGLYSVDLDEERSRKRPARFGWENKYSVPETSASSESSTSFVALAAPGVGRIYTFRIEKEEMILEVILGKGAPARQGFVGPSPLDI